MKRKELLLSDSSKLAALAAYVVARERGAKHSAEDAELVRGIEAGLTTRRAAAAAAYMLAEMNDRTAPEAHLADSLLDWARSVLDGERYA